MSIEKVIQAIPEWINKPINVSKLPGGLTNQNFLVEVEDHLYTVRCLASNTDSLQIDRQNEFECTKAAAATGIGPKVFRRLLNPQTLILDFIPGKTMTSAELSTARNVERLARGFLQLHQAPLASKEFDIVKLFYSYSNVVRSKDIRVPAGYSVCWDFIDDISKALSRHPQRKVMSHNDLLAENVIDDGKRLWFIDYEYAGNNDPCFDLGNVVNEMNVDDEGALLLCHTYFGLTNDCLLGRIQLNCLMANMVWCLWGCIQKTTSTIDYDFWSYALEKWERASSRLASHALKTWIQNA